jgi:hypothetical protein
MQVKTPVGTFPLHLVGIRVDTGRPTLDTAMGAWRSEVTAERSDAPLAALLLAVLAAMFLLGRASSGRR